MTAMDLTTYTGLKAAVASFLSRADLTDAIPGFITLAETQVRRRFGKMAAEGKSVPRRLYQRADGTFDASEEFVAVPTRFVGPRTLILDATPIIELDYLTPETFTRTKKERVYASGDNPEFYTVIGGEFQILPIPATSFTAEINFLQMPAALSATVASNWLLEDHPDIYLYGALLQSAPFLDHDSRLGTWGTLFTKGIEDACDGDPMPTNKAQRRWDDAPRALNLRTGSYRG